MRKTTRGKTRRERLGLWLRWFEHHFRGTNTFTSRSIIDLGYGEKPYSTIELAEMAQCLDVPPAIIGIEASEHRHRQALALATPEIEYLFGDAQTIAQCKPTAKLVRAINVLRQYPPAEVSTIRRSWLDFCQPDTLLTEGTTDRDGNVLGMWVLGQERSATLVLGASCLQSFAPAQVRAALPNDLRWQHSRPTWVDAFFSRWTELWRETPSDLKPSERFVGSIEALHQSHPSWVRSDLGLWNLGLAEFQPDHIKADTTG